jgi:hypothetical protein
MRAAVIPVAGALPHEDLHAPQLEVPQGDQQGDQFVVP